MDQVPRLSDDPLAQHPDTLSHLRRSGSSIMVLSADPQTATRPDSPAQEACAGLVGHSPDLSSCDALAEATLGTPIVDTGARKPLNRKARKKGKPRQPRKTLDQIVRPRAHADMIAEQSYLTLALHAQSAKAHDLALRRGDLEHQLSLADRAPATAGRSGARQLRKKLGRARGQYERARQQEQAIFARLAELFSELRCREAYWQARHAVPPVCGWIAQQQQQQQQPILWQPQMLPCIDTQTPDGCLSWDGSAFYASPGEQPCRVPVNTPLDPHQPSFTPSLGSEASSLSSFQSSDPGNSSFLETVNESSENEKTEEESAYEDDDDDDDDVEIIVSREKEKDDRLDGLVGPRRPRERRLSLPCALLTA